MQTSNSLVMLLGEANFNEELLSACWLSSSKISGLVGWGFFFLLRIMLQSCSKLKVKLSIKRSCSQHAGSLSGFFWRDPEQFIFLLRIKQLSCLGLQAERWRNLQQRFPAQSLCVAVLQGQGFCMDAKIICKAGEQCGEQSLHKLKCDLKSKLIILLACLPLIRLHFMRDGCPALSSACWSLSSWYFWINRLPGDLLPC